MAINMNDEIKFIFFGWSLGLISSLLIPELNYYLEKYRDKKNFIKILTIEIEKLENRLQNDIKRFYEEYELNKSNNYETDLIYQLINYSPIILGNPYNLIFYQENYKKLIYLSDDKRKKTIDIFERLSTMNSYIQIYKDLSSEIDNKSIVSFKNKLVICYFGHLKIVNEEIGSI